MKTIETKTDNVSETPVPSGAGNDIKMYRLSSDEWQRRALAAEAKIAELEAKIEDMLDEIANDIMDRNLA